MLGPAPRCRGWPGRGRARRVFPRARGRYCRSGENGPALGGWDVQVADEDEVERTWLGLVLANVGADPLDLDAALGGELPGEVERSVGEVHGGNAPTVLGEPDRVPGRRRRRGRGRAPAASRRLPRSEPRSGRPGSGARAPPTVDSSRLVPCHAIGYVMEEDDGCAMSGGDRFRDRGEAGRFLGERLREYAGRDDVLVLALPRGGVPVAREVARSLGAPLDVFVVRKLGLPEQPELAMGAIATGGIRVVNEELVRQLGLTVETIAVVAATEAAELGRRELAYRGARPAPAFEGKIVILVDDGIATGSSMRAAVAAVRSQGPQRVVVAVPTAPPRALEELRPEVDDLVWVIAPRALPRGGPAASRTSRGLRRRRATGDRASRGAADRGGRRSRPAGGWPRRSSGCRRSRRLRPRLGIEPPQPTQPVRRGRAQRRRAPPRCSSILRRAEGGGRPGRAKHRSTLRCSRSIACGARMGEARGARALPLGLFGASRSRAVALLAAARGRTGCAPSSLRGAAYLAGAVLGEVLGPTLLVDGERDEDVLALNRRRWRQSASPAHSEIVSGATHRSWRGRGSLEQVAGVLG